jgi:tetratricopeptide (TPR) repeat protein
MVSNLADAPSMAPTVPASLVATAAPPAGSGAWAAVAARLAQRVADADRARAVLRRLLAQGHAPAQTHFALGVDAWAQGRAAEARLHWERANEIAPGTPVIANNLAWLLFRSDPPDLPRALGLVNLAIEKAPQETNFRDTRGHILARMGKWREALADLEAALPNTANSTQMHRTLADVYDHLDAPAMAAEHRRLAAESAADTGAQRRP